MTRVHFTTKVQTMIGIGTGIIALVAGLATALQYYLPRTEFETQKQALRVELLASDARIAAYDELGMLETRIELIVMRIRQLNVIEERRELTADEKAERELKGQELLMLRERQRALIEKMKTG